MLQLEDLKGRTANLANDFLELEKIVGYNNLKKDLQAAEAKTGDPCFWDDKLKSQQVLCNIKTLKYKITCFETLKEKQEELEVLLEVVEESKTESNFLELLQYIKAQEKLLNKFKLEMLFVGEYDQNDAILTFHAGAGGTEAEDWVEMLYRMYSMWCADHEFKIKVLNYLPGDECGIKSASILVQALNAYGLLKSEMGVHRLVRISPFDASGRRHTSFASLEVIPELEESSEVQILDSDLKIDTFRASGAGGQHVNKTESAVRITHIKTGIVVACQNERSQHQNKEMAMRMLISKLIKIKEREHLEHIEDIKGSQAEIAWGSQMRSYVFMPYTLVKDHRTGYETGNISAVMNGDLDDFIMAYLKQNIAN